MLYLDYTVSANMIKSLNTPVQKCLQRQTKYFRESLVARLFDLFVLSYSFPVWMERLWFVAGSSPKSSLCVCLWRKIMCCKYSVCLTSRASLYFHTTLSICYYECKDLILTASFKILLFVHRINFESKYEYWGGLLLSYLIVSNLFLSSMKWLLILKCKKSFSCSVLSKIWNKNFV